MCGIVAMTSTTTPVNLLLLYSIRQLLNRGYDSAGVAVLHDDQVHVLKKTSCTGDAIDQCQRDVHTLPTSTIGCAHTRWATHGKVTINNCHPHVSHNTLFSIVHNGTITNFEALRGVLPHPPRSETDTEIMVEYIAMVYDTLDTVLPVLQRVQTAIKNAEAVFQGTWSFVIMTPLVPNTLFAMRNELSLLVGYTDTLGVVVSERHAFPSNVRHLGYAEDNVLYTITPSECVPPISFEPFERPIEATSPAPYLHWTLKEIEDQPECAHRLVTGVHDFASLPTDIQHVIFLGCGTSLYAGMMGQYMLHGTGRFETVQVFNASDFDERHIPRQASTLYILLSQSGETKDVYRCLHYLHHAFTVGIINQPGSLIARNVTKVYHLDAGREHGVASTKSFTSQVVMLQLLAHHFAPVYTHNTISCSLVEVLAVAKEWARRVAATIHAQRATSIFILGKGFCSILANEAALKIKEIAYYHAEGYSGSELKHGTFALLEEHTPVILLDTDTQYHTSMGNVKQEVMTRTDGVFTVTTEGVPDTSSLVLNPNADVTITTIVPLQLLAYELSVLRGLNPDRPRNLAKVVTVD